jgi:hypothetical protein
MDFHEEFGRLGSAGEEAIHLVEKAKTDSRLVNIGWGGHRR